MGREKNRLFPYNWPPGGKANYIEYSFSFAYRAHTYSTSERGIGWRTGETILTASLLFIYLFICCSGTGLLLLLLFMVTVRWLWLRICAGFIIQQTKGFFLHIPCVWFGVSLKAPVKEAPPQGSHACLASFLVCRASIPPPPPVAESIYN